MLYEKVLCVSKIGITSNFKSLPFGEDVTIMKVFEGLLEPDLRRRMDLTEVIELIKSSINNKKDSQILI